MFISISKLNSKRSTNNQFHHWAKFGLKSYAQENNLRTMKNLWNSLLKQIESNPKPEEKQLEPLPKTTNMRPIFRTSEESEFVELNEGRSFDMALGDEKQHHYPNGPNSNRRFKQKRQESMNTERYTFSHKEYWWLLVFEEFEHIPNAIIWFAKHKESGLKTSLEWEFEDAIKIIGCKKICNVCEKTKDLTCLYESFSWSYSHFINNVCIDRKSRDTFSEIIHSSMAILVYLRTSPLIQVPYQNTTSFYFKRPYRFPSLATSAPTKCIKSVSVKWVKNTWNFMHKKMRIIMQMKVREK